MQQWLLECERWNDERAEPFLLLSRVSPDCDCDLTADVEKLFTILDQGWKHHSILRINVKM